jgi:hypothetical protein
MATDSADQKVPTRLTPEDHTAFLGRDFDQAFSEKRHIEQQLWDICKFAFTAHTTLVGVAIGAYSYSRDRTPNLVPAATVVLAITLAVGMFLVLMMVRARVNFVAVCRYINEQRAFFLRDNPVGFKNSTGYYNDPARPKYFSWRSTQTWATLLVSLFNSAAGATLVFLLARRDIIRAITWALIFAAIFFATQTVAVHAYLRSREGLTTSEVIPGKRP